jgi:hypothetical protein
MFFSGLNGKLDKILANQVKILALLASSQTEGTNIMSALTDLQTSVTTLSTGLSSFSTDFTAAIAALTAAVGSNDDAGVETQVAALNALATQVQALDATAKAAVPAPAAPAAS